MRRLLWVLGVGFGLACGGGAGGEPKESEVAFTTYEAGRSRMVFTSTSKVKRTWRNMSGDAVRGTYTHVGKEITIDWDPKATNYSGRHEKFRQMGPCSMARYEMIDSEGKIDDDPWIFEQKKPRCDTVKLR